MNFVELLFGISPDGGNGTFEFLLFLIPVLLLLLVPPWRRESFRDLGQCDAKSQNVMRKVTPALSPRIKLKEEVVIGKWRR